MKQKFTLKFFSKRKKLHDFCIYLLARANFELSNDDEFNIYIDEITRSDFLAKKMFLKISYIIIKGNNTPFLNDLISELKSLENEETEKYYVVCKLLYRIKFENYVCSSEEVNMLKKIASDRIIVELLNDQK